MRLCRQRLVGPPFSDPVEAVRWFGAVQSQDFAGAAWGIGQRCAGLDEAGFRRLFDDGKIVRSHLLRPTWHVVAPEDLRWMLELTAPRVQAINAPYYRQCELDEVLLGRCTELIVAALEGGRQLTRAELAAVLETAGVPASGLRLALIVMNAELEVVICSGAIRGRQHTYALVDERVAPTRSRTREEALGELARRYFESHGPAQLRDFAWWSGLRSAEAREAIELAGKSREPDWAPTRPVPTVNLLPNYDEFLVAYQDRPPEVKAAFSLNTVLQDGRVVGTWKRLVTKGFVAVTPSLWKDTDARLQRGLDAAIARYAQFLGVAVKQASRPPQSS